MHASYSSVMSFSALSRNSSSSSSCWLMKNVLITCFCLVLHQALKADKEVDEVRNPKGVPECCLHNPASAVYYCCKQLLPSHCAGLGMNSIEQGQLRHLLMCCCLLLQDYHHRCPICRALDAINLYPFIWG